MGYFAAKEAVKTLETHELLKFIIFWLILPILGVLWGWLLLHAYPKFGQFVWNVFCDSQGKPAYGRMASWFALNACLLWDTHIVWKTEKVPDLWGQLFFVGGLFAIEKLPEFAAAIKGIQLPQAKVGEIEATRPA